jgi:anaerobic selenocysteine-containing dehydrogenase
MGVSRRDFLKISGSTLLLGPLAAPAPADAQEQEIKTKGAKETTLRDCAGSGRVVRTRRNDESLDRPEEC